MKTMKAKDLKNALLQEAVQGKLVPQIAAEGSARDLLNAIREEKAELIKAGKLKKEKPLPEITPDEIPFDIPESWCWCRLGELITFVGGYAYDSHSFIEKSEYQVLRLGNVKNGYLQLSAKPVYINAELADKTKAFKCITNDILVTMTGTRLKRDYFFTTLISENNKNLYLNQRVGCLRPTKIIYASFLAWILKSKTVLDYIFEFETGTANQGNLGSENIKTIPIPLPPLSEQKRIVAAIEQFMPLIDEYGKKEEVLSELNAAIGEQAKKALLQEAVQGKLVPQIAAEGNAADLLKQIQAEKAQLIKEGKLKKEKPLPPITDDEIPFDIPESWEWVKLGEIVKISTGDKDANQGEENGKYEFYTCSMIPIRSNTYSFDGECLILPGNGANVGLVLFHNGKFEAYQRTYVLEKIGNSLYLKYLFHMMNYNWKSYNNNKLFGSAIPYIKLGNLSNYPVPLPPIAEQKRIVSALEKMLPLCERLGK